MVCSQEAGAPQEVVSSATPMLTLLVIQYAPERVIRAPTGPCPDEGLTSASVGGGTGVAVGGTGVSVGVGETAGAACAPGAKKVAEAAIKRQSHTSARLAQALATLSVARRPESGRWPGTRAIERLALCPPHRHGGSTIAEQVVWVKMKARSGMARVGVR